LTIQGFRQLPAAPGRFARFYHSRRQLRRIQPKERLLVRACQIAGTPTNELF
jgi:hypothetical protein